jgi:hypothetical protein
LDNGNVGELKSDWGASIQYGRSYRLHKKPIANVATFNIDYTGIDLNVNHFKAEGLGQYDSRQKHAGEGDKKTDDDFYTLPWNMEKYEVNYGMALGPSLTLAPFNLLNGNGLHFIKFNVFYHIGYNVSMIYSPNDKKLDVNQSELGVEYNKERYEHMESNLKMSWGHGMIQSFGVNVSWKAIGLAYEHRTGKIKYKAMNTSDFGNNEYEFTNATNRISLQIRM